MIPAGHTNADLIASVAEAYMPENALVVDMTFGRGVFWKKCTHRRMTLYASDLKIITVDPALLDGSLPLRIIPRRADFRQLPYDAGFFDTVVLDPPYAHGLRTHMSGTRYTHATTNGMSHAAIMAELYLPGIIEAARVLKPGGQLWVKGKNEIESGKQCWAPCEIPALAATHGYFTLWDEAILATRPPNPNRWKGQRHLRHAHSFLYVFNRTTQPVEVLGSHGAYRGRRSTHTGTETNGDMGTVRELETKQGGPSSQYPTETPEEMGTVRAPKTKLRGNSRQYLIDRLTRDHPHIVVRLMVGEFRSIRAAAVAAGIIKQGPTPRS
jgi:hypothetical protein